jgi:hypothetical protein
MTTKIGHNSPSLSLEKNLLDLDATAKKPNDQKTIPNKAALYPPTIEDKLQITPARKPSKDKPTITSKEMRPTNRLTLNTFLVFLAQIISKVRKADVGGMKMNNMPT